MRSITRTVSALAAVAILATACTSAGGGAAATSAPSAAAPVAATASPPAPTPVPPPQEITAPPATPKPTTDAEGPEHVVGVITDAVLSTPYNRTNIGTTGEVTETIRDGVVTLTLDMNDARASGKAAFAFGIDLYDYVGPDWGTMHLPTASGAWDGPCSGASWSEGDGLLASCWLTGSGDVAGYTYYLALTGPANGDGKVEGIIYPGTPPTP